MTEDASPNPYASPQARNVASNHIPILIGIAKRFGLVSLATIATTLVVFAGFCILWPSFAPVRMIQVFGFRVASDDIARLVAFPIAFIAPALLVAIVGPAFTQFKRASIVAYLVLATAGTGLSVVFVVSQASHTRPDTYDRALGVFCYLPSSAGAIALVGFLLCARWLFGKS